MLFNGRWTGGCVALPTPPPLCARPPPLPVCRYTYLLDLALQHDQSVLMVGPTGTGKSVYINRHLLQVRGGLGV